MGKKIYSELPPEAIEFARSLVAEKSMARHDAYSLTDTEYSLIPGSTASCFGKKGARVTNKKKKG